MEDEENIDVGSKDLKFLFKLLAKFETGSITDSFEGMTFAEEIYVEKIKKKYGIR